MYEVIAMDDFMTVKEAAEKWGISTRRVAILCAEGRIVGAKKIGSMWFIPADAVKPYDKRLHKGDK